MADFSVEAAARRIVDSRTAEYFREVHSSYSAGNMRSATVMLWSVVIADIWFKVDQLATTFNDPIATGIRTKVLERQQANPRSPEWEGLLLDEVRQRTELLNDAEHAALLDLQAQRHYCAHPVLDQHDALFLPSPEQVRSFVRLALDSVLTKPAVMSRRVFDALVEDLEVTGASLPDQDSLRRFLESKYFSRMSDVVLVAIFRSLWKLTFRLDDSRCEANREINSRALALLYDRNPHLFDDEVAADPTYYSDLSSSDSCLMTVLSFLPNRPVLYGMLEEHARTVVGNYARADMTRLSMAWFLNETFSDHVQELIRWAEGGSRPASGAFGVLRAQAATEEEKTLVMKLIATTYGKAYDYDNADAIFAEIVAPALPEMDAEQILELVAASEANRQTYDRWRASGEHGLIVKRAAELGVALDPADFPDFCANVVLSTGAV